MLRGLIVNWIFKFVAVPANIVTGTVGASEDAKVKRGLSAWHSGEMVAYTQSDSLGECRKARIFYAVLSAVSLNKRYKYV